MLLAAVLVAGYAPASAGRFVPREQITAPSIAGYPDSIASTGDSITRAFNTGGVPFTDAPANSWATGTSASVMSHYSRILPNHPQISGQAYNNAVTGAQMVDLNGQAQNAVTQGAAYVTILLGANDACTDTEAQMTPVATYRAQFQSAMNTLAAGLPDSRIYVLSVPDIYNLWFILKDNASARATWSLLGICQSMLANPLSTNQADVDRRNRVRQRVIDYNTQLAQVCATNIHCKFDDNATFNTVFVPADVSTRDYFHPSLSGQAKIAEVSFAASFDFREGVTPSSVATLTKKSRANSVVTITSQDNVGVRGIEYKIGTGPFILYTGPVNVQSGSTITYRAVDVNGNVEPARTLAVQ